MDKEIKSYMKFFEGKKEQDKIDELLDIMSRRKLTPEEKDLLVRLHKGEKLDDNVALQKHKTGGLLFDDQGNVLTTDQEPDKSGVEFVTTKGKQKGVDKIPVVEEVIDARIYKNKDSEIRFIYAFTTNVAEDGTKSTDWIVYRTDGGEKYPYGIFLDTNAPKYNFYKRITPDQLWKELDYSFDYGMVLDRDLYQDFMNFVELYKENQARNRDVLTRIRNRFLKLL